METPNQFSAHLKNELSGPKTGDEDLRWINVGPFSAQDAEKFLDRNFPNLSKQVLSKAVGAAEGVPMFLASLAEQLCTMPADQIESDSLDWTRGLSPEARRLLEFVCASGYPLPQAIAFEAAEMIQDLEVSISALSARRLITLNQLDSGLMLTPFHDMIRESIHGKLDAGGRMQVHASIAAASEDKPGVPPDRLAFHFREAGDRAKCCRYSILAGDAAAKSRAFAEAVRSYEDALQDFEGASEQKLKLKQKLAFSLGQLGRSSEAGDLYFELAAQEERGHQFFQQAAYQYCVAGRVEDASQGFDRLLKPWGYTTFDSGISVLWRLAWLRLKMTVSDKASWFKRWKSKVAGSSDKGAGSAEGAVMTSLPTETQLDGPGLDHNRLCDLLWDVHLSQPSGR
jgi:tetratricopeptide (TPR) repeat protein